MIILGNRVLHQGSGESRWHAKTLNEATPRVLFVTIRELRFRVMNIHWEKKSWYWKAFFQMSMAISAQAPTFAIHRDRAMRLSAKWVAYYWLNYINSCPMIPRKHASILPAPAGCLDKET